MYDHSEWHRQPGTAAKSVVSLCEGSCEPCPLAEINRKLFDQGLMSRDSFGVCSSHGESVFTLISV